MRSNYSFINVYKKNNKKSGIVTQLLYGDAFKIIKKKGAWIKIKNDIDKYKGYIKNKSFLENQNNTHKTHNLYTTLYSKPKNNYNIKEKISYGSKVKILEEKGKFVKFDNIWVKKKDLKKINFTTKNIFYDVKKFVNTKYKWGGKHFTGIDCSGLIQIFLNYNNKICPRDTKDQIKYFKKKIHLKKIKRNDLIFWKGHVAIAISKKRLIHAYGPEKKVLVMPIKKTIDLIYKTAKLKIIGVRRIS
jgi:cell wall-associated NlpC family hydrolase